MEFGPPVYNFYRQERRIKCQRGRDSPFKEFFRPEQMTTEKVNLAERAREGGYELKSILTVLKLPKSTYGIIARIERLITKRNCTLVLTIKYGLIILKLSKEKESER